MVSNSWVLARHYTGKNREVEPPTEGTQADGNDLSGLVEQVSEFWHEGDPMTPEVKSLVTVLYEASPAILAALRGRK